MNAISLVLVLLAAPPDMIGDPNPSPRASGMIGDPFGPRVLPASLKPVPTPTGLPAAADRAQRWALEALDRPPAEPLPPASPGPTPLRIALQAEPPPADPSPVKGSPETDISRDQKIAALEALVETLTRRIDVLERTKAARPQPAQPIVRASPQSPAPVGARLPYVPDGPVLRAQPVYSSAPVPTYRAAPTYAYPAYQGYGVGTECATGNCGQAQAQGFGPGLFRGLRGR